MIKSYFSRGFTIKFYSHCEISGSHSGEDEAGTLLGCGATQSRRSSRRFRDAYCIHYHGHLMTEAKQIWNVGLHLRDYTVPYLIRLPSSIYSLFVSPPHTFQPAYTHGLNQGWAKYGPLRGWMRPAEGLENAKKMRCRKTFENHVHVCFLIFVWTSFFQHEASKKQC
jgi:hypothetical protein